MTLLAAAGEPNVKEKLKQGHVANGKTFKVHLDGYDQRELLAGKEPGQRQEIFYFDDSGNLNAVRVRDWKAIFAEPGDWLYGGPPLPLAFPRIANLRMDPFEAHVNFAESPMAMRWVADKIVGLRAHAGAGRDTSCSRSEFPQRQKSASFNIDQVMARLNEGSAAGK